MENSHRNSFNSLPQRIGSPGPGSNPNSDHNQSFHDYNPLPQNAPGSHAAVGHTIDNSIPLSIFPMSLDKLLICFCGLPGRGKTHISRRLARYLTFFHAIPVEVFNVAEYRREYYGALKDAVSYQTFRLR